MSQSQQIIEASARRTPVRYEIRFLRDLFCPENRSFADVVTSLPGATPTDTLVVVDGGIPPVLRKRIHASCEEAGFRTGELKGGEAGKTESSAHRLLQAMRRAALSRHGLLIGVGGGALLDVVGAAASTYRRGIRYLRIPTTLLAQVDAAVGIKVGYNFAGEKNLIGGMYPPEAVLIDITTLETLDRVQRRCGLAEVLKIALISSPGLFHELEEFGQLYVEDGRLEPARLTQLIEDSVVALLDELLPDLYERDPKRKVDLGHEVAHSLEAASGFHVSHGDAVAMGIAIASQVSRRRGILAERCHERIAALINGLGFPPLDHPRLDDLAAQVVAQTKKHKGRFLFVLPRAIGDCMVADDVTESELLEACVAVEAGAGKRHMNRSNLPRVSDEA